MPGYVPKGMEIICSRDIRNIAVFTAEGRYSSSPIETVLSLSFNIISVAAAAAAVMSESAEGDGKTRLIASTLRPIPSPSRMLPIWTRSYTV